MRDIDVHDFHRRVIINGEPVFAGLRAAAAAAVTGIESRPAFGDWTAWQGRTGDKSGISYSDWGVWTKIR